MKRHTLNAITKTQVRAAVATPQFQDAMYSMAAVFSLFMTATVVFWYLTSGL